MAMKQAPEPKTKAEDVTVFNIGEHLSGPGTKSLKALHEKAPAESFTKIADTKPYEITLKTGDGIITGKFFLPEDGHYPTLVAGGERIPLTLKAGKVTRDNVEIIVENKGKIGIYNLPPGGILDFDELLGVNLAIARKATEASGTAATVVVMPAIVEHIKMGLDTGLKPVQAGILFKATD